MRSLYRGVQIDHVRQCRFIPKGKPVDDVEVRLIEYVENWCNTLPRKILAFKTPDDQFALEMELLERSVPSTTVV